MMSGDSSNRPATQVLACDLSAIDDREAHQETGNRLFGRVEQADELDDGYAFRFPGTGDAVDDTFAFVRNERLCCPFLTFEIVLEHDHGSVWLRMRGSAEIKTFLRAEMGEALPG